MYHYINYLIVNHLLIRKFISFINIIIKLNIIVIIIFIIILLNHIINTVLEILFFHFLFFHLNKL